MTGSELLREIASLWQVEPAQIRQVEEGFDWWPGSHLVQVRAVPPRPYHPENSGRWALVVQTELLRSPAIESSAFTRHLATMMEGTISTYAFVYPPPTFWNKHADGRRPAVTLFCSAYVNSEMTWLPRFFAGVALLQVINAEFSSEQWAKELGAEPAFVGPGRARGYDDRLNLVRDLYVPQGAKPSRWRDVAEFAAFVQRFGNSDTCLGIANHAGMALETPFGEDAVLIRLRSHPSHEQLGNGLYVTLELPYVASLDDAVENAAYLNYWESKFWTDFPQLGCWHVVEMDNDEARVVHTSFIPNALYTEGIASNFALWSIGRARTVRKQWFPKLADKTMNEILHARIRAGLQA